MPGGRHTPSHGGGSGTSRRGSGSTTPVRGQYGGRGGFRGGRGRGVAFQDMSSMSLDYSAKVDEVDTASPVVAERFHDSTREGGESSSTGPSSTMRVPGQAQHTNSTTATTTTSFKQPTQYAPKGPQRVFNPSLASKASNNGNAFSNESATFKPVRHVPPSSYHQPKAGPSYYTSTSSSNNGYQHSSKKVALKHAGIGTYNRRPEAYQHDASLTRPVQFVKASTSIKPTLEPEEQERYLAQQSLDNLFNKARSPLSVDPLPLPSMSSSTGIQTATPPPPPSAVAASSTMQRDTSNTSSGSAKSALSPHAQPFDRPSFLKHAHTGLGYAKHPHPTAPKSSAPPSSAPTEAQQATSSVEQPSDNKEEPLFVIDTIGMRTEQLSISTPHHPIAIPERSVQIPTKSETVGPQDMDEDESDTEELWPRRVPAAATSAKTATGPSQSIPTVPYARVVEDNIPSNTQATAARPAEAQLLSDEARALLDAATAVAPEPVNKHRKISKKEAKRIKKENKRKRKRNARLGLRSAANSEPRIPREGDSDLDWGSDGPPGPDEMDEDVDDSEDMDAEMTINMLTGSGGPAKMGQKNRARRGKLSAVDAAVEDYLANLARQSDSDEDSEASLIKEADLAALRRFAQSVSGVNGEHLTIDDLDDIARMREEDEEEGDDSDAEEDEMVYEERCLRKSFVKAQFPIYIRPTEIDSDLNDESNQIFKSSDDSDEDEAIKKWDRAGKDLASQAAKKSNSSDEDSTEDEDLARLPALSDEDDEDEDEDADDDDDDDGLIVRAKKITVVEGNDEHEEESEDDDDEDEEDENEDDEDDDEDEVAGDHDDYDELFASQSARRKNQAPGFMGDEFDEMLQKQWRKDREKKAIRRQERALARLEKKPTRANAKKAKRAAEKAKGFRDDDDVDSDIDGGVLSKLPQFHKINDDLRRFIEHSGGGEYALPPMDKKFRYAIHMLADAYNLKSKSRGVGKGRHNVLYRTQHTTIRGADQRKINKYLTITSSWRTGSNKEYTYERPSRGGGGGGRGGGAPVSRNAEGAVVGEGADRIQSDNVGHQMLAKMGWTEGMKIGKTGGIDQPIVAVIKTSKAGLGSGWVRYNRGTVTTVTSGEGTETVGIEEAWGMAR